MNALDVRGDVHADIDGRGQSTQELAAGIADIADGDDAAGDGQLAVERQVAQIAGVDAGQHAHMHEAADEIAFVDAHGVHPQRWLR